MNFTLIIPDVHEQIEKLEKLDGLIFKADRVVLLGDFFDTFGPSENIQTAKWVRERLFDPKFTFLLGNHDVHYASPNIKYRCSGYDWNKETGINHVLDKADWMQFKIHTKVGKFLLSHAGYRPETKHFLNEEEDALQMLWDGGYHPLFAAGYGRGGEAEFGGPTWLDWSTEFTGLVGQPQIVGHTQAQMLRTKEVRGQKSHCIDTNLRKVMMIYDDEEINWVQWDSESKTWETPRE